MSTVVIEYDGTDITDDCDIRTCQFTSMVNGQVGQCVIKVKDPLRNKSFTVGKILRLVIDGDPVWSGYLLRVKRAYAFPYQDTTTLTNITRYLVLEGADINILFTKRYVMKAAEPTEMSGPTYPAATSDLTVLADLFADWLTLSGDSIDTSTYVDHVDNVNVDQKGNYWQAGMTWGGAMRTIAAIPGAVFYIRPDRKLVWTDVDTINAPFTLSDKPGVGEVGYREFRIDRDGSNLANDAMVWGAGGGSATPVFKRLQDSSSITEHGRWQYGQFYGGVWKQATLDKIANSLVYGSPLNKRGRKDDQVSVDLVLKEPGLLPGMKAWVVSHVFGWSDSLPVRKMTITFVGPTDPLYQYTLSHEIDQALEGLMDPIYIVPINVDSPRIPDIDPPEFPQIEEDPGSPVIIIDDFSNRVLVDQLGESSGGYLYDPVTYLSGTRSAITFDSLRIYPNVATGSASFEAILAYDPFSGTTNYPLGMGAEGTFSFRFRTTAIRDANRDKLTEITIRNLITTVDDINEWSLYIYVSNYSGSPTEHGQVWIASGSSPTGGDEYVKNDWAANTWYTCEVKQEASTVSIRVYSENESPPSWQASDTVTNAFPWVPDTDPSSGYAELFFDSPAVSDASTVTSIGELEFDDIMFTPAVIIDPQPELPQPGGWVCEDIAGAHASMYTLSSSYLAGSTEVSLGGTRQRRGIDYFETLPSDGIITFASLIEAGEKIRACYTVATADGGVRGSVLKYK